jgi:peptidoglycan hydrolase-like protein with peptidoglycan-binding domain
VLEIQYELSKRGFYAGEPSGVYDETTILAMWEFQKNYGLPATGYPTAHSLKRLGLTNW